MPYTELSDIKLYYEVHGQGQPLLFLHGLGSSILDWENQVPFFAKNFQVIVCDLRGHGKSDKPNQPYTIALFAEDVKQLLNNLNIPTAHIVGHSMGGMIAFQLAVDSPQLNQSLCILNSAPNVSFTSFKEKLLFFSRSWVIKWMGMKRLSRVLAEKVYPKKEQLDLRNKFITRWCQNDFRAYLNSLKAFEHWDVRQQLDNISCPTLVISADRDYTPITCKETYVKQIKHASLRVIENSGHMTQLDQPLAFNTLLSHFLKKEGSSL